MAGKNLGGQQPVAADYGSPRAAGSPHVPFGSNAVRLSVRQWLVASGILLLMAWGVPLAWKQAEPLEPGPDYRVPYPLSHDYWMVRRWFDHAASGPSILVLGDSVVWGHYVQSRQTLSHYLSQLDGEHSFSNLGVDGIHPAALAGLVEHYAKSVRGRRVLLHCNPLWMSSPRHDLAIDKEFAFNHPALVPQFMPWIPCYRETLSRRLGIVVRRHVPFFSWIDHLEIAYFDNTDLAAWTMEHPYANPLEAPTLRLPSPDTPPSPRPVARPWFEQGIERFNPPWVDLAVSFQWERFRRTVEILRRRDNRVFVLVGPFNQHMLVPESRRAYQARWQQAVHWLQTHGIPPAAPPPLASHQYADASHPLAEGYRSLAQGLLRDQAFRAFVNRAAPTE